MDLSVPEKFQSTPKGPKKTFKGPLLLTACPWGMGSQFQVMCRGAPQSLFYRGPELLSTALDKSRDTGN